VVEASEGRRDGHHEATSRSPGRQGWALGHRGHQTPRPRPRQDCHRCGAPAVHYTVRAPGFCPMRSVCTVAKGAGSRCAQGRQADCEGVKGKVCVSCACSGWVRWACPADVRHGWAMSPEQENPTHHRRKVNAGRKPNSMVSAATTALRFLNTDEIIV
jgi:hypothetical protein